MLPQTISTAKQHYCVPKCRVSKVSTIARIEGLKSYYVLCISDIKNTVLHRKYQSEAITTFHWVNRRFDCKLEYYINNIKTNYRRKNAVTIKPAMNGSLLCDKTLTFSAVLLTSYANNAIRQTCDNE